MIMEKSLLKAHISVVITFTYFYIHPSISVIVMIAGDGGDGGCFKLTLKGHGVHRRRLRKNPDFEI